jgi:hypothetical protein
VEQPAHPRALANDVPVSLENRAEQVYVIQYSLAKTGAGYVVVIGDSLQEPRQIV